MLSFQHFALGKPWSLRETSRVAIKTIRHSYYLDPVFFVFCLLHVTFLVEMYLTNIWYELKSWVPISIIFQWENCLARTRGMQFMVIHIYREGNNCIDRLADFWFNVADFKWWNVLLDFIRHDFNKYRIGFAFINIFDIALLWGFFFPLYGYCLFVFLSTLIIFGFA